MKRCEIAPLPLLNTCCKFFGTDYKMRLVEKNGGDQEFVQFLQEQILLLKTPQYEELFRQEMSSFNESKYVNFMDKCLYDMCMKGFTRHQQWFNKTIALFDKQDFAKQYDEFIHHAA
ncbi:MAG: hypothetical protein GY782_05410 [Gammaproteobacteria bacterium]|nr:hypothetical protein [Gammaproteobacteria bacterium]